jgi:hypothetical protein
MNKPIRLLRLSPEAAGELHEQHAELTREVRELKRYATALDYQLKTLLGQEALRNLHRDTEIAILTADLSREVA